MKSSKKIKTKYVVLSIVLAVFFVSLSIFISKKPNQPPHTNSNQQAQTTPTPSPKKLPHGKETFIFSHGELVVGPKPTQLIIDPIDPKYNQKQTLTITIPHNKPIATASATIITDNLSEKIELQKISSDIYSASWNMKDNYKYKYIIKLEFSDDTETFTGDLRFR